jgi:hypothetical protein
MRDWKSVTDTASLLFPRGLKGGFPPVRTRADKTPPEGCRFISI